jgi:hypothetical protein
MHADKHRFFQAREGWHSCRTSHANESSSVGATSRWLPARTMLRRRRW